jgi:hypothetical protein
VDADAGPVHSGDRGGYLRPQRVEHGCHPGQAGPVRRPGGRRGRRTRRAASGGRGRLLRGRRGCGAQLPATRDPLGRALLFALPGRLFRRST